MKKDGLQTLIPLPTYQKHHVVSNSKGMCSFKRDIEMINWVTMDATHTYLLTCLRIYYKKSHYFFVDGN